MTQLPKIVTQRLQTATHAVHPDPDVIAAFVEKSLDERQRDQLLGHLAQCSDCREVLALSFPEHEAAPPAATPVRPVWRAWPVLRWGALAACVVVVGAAVTLHRPRPSLPAERTDTAQETSLHETNAVPETAIYAQAPEANAKPDATAKKLKTADEKSPKSLAMLAKTETPAAPIPGTRDEIRSNPLSAEAAAKVSPSYNAMDEAVPGRAKDAPQASSPEPQSAGGVVAANSTVGRAQAALVANKSALAAPVALPPRWTLSADGTLQRSLDSGMSWETIPVAGQSSFRALAADGLEIWVGGAKGSLYHSSDAGQKWAQVQPSTDGEVLTGDIIEVEFTGRLHGAVTTSGQQKWVTADGGQSWQKQ